jgi:hypothetical protein
MGKKEMTSLDYFIQIVSGHVTPNSILAFGVFTVLCTTFFLGFSLVKVKETREMEHKHLINSVAFIKEERGNVSEVVRNMREEGLRLQQIVIKNQNTIDLQQKRLVSLNKEYEYFKKKK